jgi:hypothetical protein
VDWLRRIGHSGPEAPAVRAPAEPVPAPVEGAAPGVAALLKGVGEDRSHAVLDLGPAAEQSLRVYGRFARWVRFADVLNDTGWPQAHTAGPLRTALPRPARPYDLVFAWDILDRLFAEDRPRLMEWLADVIAPDTRLHMVMRASEDVPMRPLRFTLLDVGRIRYQPTGTSQLPPSRLMPADVARLLAPFHVVNAFTLRIGLREYVAARR